MQETPTPDSVRDVAFIGTGLMGGPMVHRLLGAGFAVRVWNRTSNKLEPLLAAGAVRAASPAEAAEGADAICVCLANASAAEAVLFGDEWHRVGARIPRPCWSTSRPSDRTGRWSLPGGCASAAASPGWTRRYPEVLPARRKASSSFFAAASAADLDRLGPLFAALAQRITRVGELGAGQTLKLCNQLIVASNLVAIAEALTLAAENGLDPGILPDALTGGFADSIPLQIFGRRMAAHVNGSETR